MLEAGHGRHKSYTPSANTSSVVRDRGHPTSDRKRGGSRQSQWTRSSEVKEDMYFVYHVNKCLSSIPAKTSDYLDLIPV